MIIYQNEIDVGLEKIILDNRTVSIDLYNKPTLTFPAKKNIKYSFAESAYASSSKDQLDLFYMRDILMTAGVLNKNDDFVFPKDAWEARHTPEDKPLNLGHNCRDIVGHITSQYAISRDKTEVLSDSLSIEKLPDSFHIVNETVIYKYWGNPEGPDEERMGQISQIIEEIQQNEWSVSMEALFAKFDYLLFNEENGETKLVNRTKNTSFLTLVTQYSKLKLSIATEK